MMRALFVFTLVFATSVSAKATVVFDNGNELLSVCGKDRSYCLGVTSGYSDMLQSLGETCADKLVTRGQAADIVVRFLRDHPKNRHLTAASLARAALTDAFPCPNKK